MTCRYSRSWLINFNKAMNIQQDEIRRGANRLLLPVLLLFAACKGNPGTGAVTAQDTVKTTGSTAVLKPLIVTDSLKHDSDDPAIWINPADPAQSLIVGTDKDTDGGLYVFNLEGKLVNQVTGLKRPNNVDIAYGLKMGSGFVDIAVATERETHSIRIFSLPDMKAIDNGGIAVFEGDTARDPMGISLYTAPDHTIYAIVGRKTGPSGAYLWQYKLEADANGIVKAVLVRKFGSYSGKKEIESIAVDNELGYVYYSDEQHGVHKYYADPAKGNAELALFATAGFTSDHEGISIYKNSAGTGYILVSNQQKNTFMVYPREGMAGKPNAHPLLAEVPVSTDESDGSEVTSLNLGAKFPKGLFVAMSNGRVFHYYDWQQVQQKIDAQKK